MGSFSEFPLPEEAVEEAKYVIRHIRGKEITMPVAFDMEYLEPTEELVVCAPKLPEALSEYLRVEPRQNLTVLLKTPETAKALSTLAPFTAAYPIPETGAMYYRCRNGACERPTTEL